MGKTPSELLAKLSANERKVLGFLVSHGHDEYCGFDHFGFSAIARGRRLNRNQVRLACRSLARKGLTIFGRGLWNEDGEPAGSGYAATRYGADLINGKMTT